MLDKPLLAITLLLLFTLCAWLAGWFVYPYGLLVLLTILIIRIIQVSSNRKS